MPQLDFSTFVPQLVWLAITFSVLYFIITKFAMPRIGGTIERRSSRITSDLEQAQSMKDDVDRAIASYEAALAEAKAKAHAIALENRNIINAEIDAERARVDARIGEKIAEAEKAIANSKDRAMGKVDKMASDLAEDIVGKLAGSKPSASALSKAIENATGK